MLDLLQKIGGLGQRLAEAGREARDASAVVAGEVTDQMTRALGLAAGEVVRAAVVGALSAVVRGARRATIVTPFPVIDPWDDLDGVTPREHDSRPEEEPVPEGQTTPSGPVRPRWVTGARAMGSALTVAAGAAASVPGGRAVAAGLGAAAALAGLAARAGEPTPAQ